MSKILLVEDDKSIVDSLKEFLIEEGYEVINVDGQKKAIELIEDKSFDLVLLDVSLKDGNGFSVCTHIKQKDDLPVIFLTASGDEGSVVTGFELGADDYISKPFRPRELISRIKNVLRRYKKTSDVVSVGDISVDVAKGVVTKNKEEIFLSALEYKLLSIFFQNRGILLSRTKLLDEIWDIAGDFVNDNTLTVYIKRLREKIEDDPSKPTIIKTVRGLGYRMD
ncbi:MAG: response regulator transcription factor [Lachnospiraceae bacterium]|nr:response regulator transcription factor [Lachnospiraceae bacterium]